MDSALALHFIAELEKEQGITVSKEDTLGASLRHGPAHCPPPRDHAAQVMSRAVSSPAAWQRAKEAAERCKIELDKAASTTVDIPFLSQGKTLKVGRMAAAGWRGRTRPLLLQRRSTRLRPS